MYCKKCGTEIKDGNLFCTNCGRSINENISTNKKTIKIKIPILIFSSIIIIVMASILIYTISTDNGTKSDIVQNDVKEIINDNLEVTQQENNDILNEDITRDDISEITELKIKNMNFDVKIKSNTDVEIVETWEISSLKNNGFFKTFELNNKFGDISNVKVYEILNNDNKKELIETFDNEYPKDGYYYALLNKDGEFEIAWGAKMVKQTKTFQISYTVTELIDVYNDCAEFYWQFLGNKYTIPVENISGKIYIENVDDVKDIQMWGHYNGNGSISKSNNYIKFLAEDFIEGNFLEVRLVLPKNVFNTNIIQNKNMLNQILNEENVNEVNNNESSVNDYYSQIYIGMSYSEVYSLLGEPTSTTKNTDMFTTYVWATKEDIIMIQFMNGQVFQKKIF